MQKLSGENAFIETIRGVLKACADCDTCRFLMDENCLLFPQLYRLYDQEKEHNSNISDDELQQLSQLCTLCGLCPCPNIRMDVIRAKTERVAARGMPFHIGLLADMQRLGQLSTLAPGLIKTALSFPPVGRLVKRAAGIHPQRRLPSFPKESFFAWARHRELDHFPQTDPKVAYFAGCSAGYIFPEVARAAVTVLERNGISVFVPSQQCCGMPTLVEGNQRITLDRVRYNMEKFLKISQAGCQLVCSCPTCGFLLKILLMENAWYSEAYQRAVNARSDEIKVPDTRSGSEGFISLKKSMYHKILKDNGYFSNLDPLVRIALSERVMDMGQYLARLHHEKRLDTRFGRIDRRVAYFAPCHQREQGIGSPYENLLALIPGLTVVPVGGAMDCCGMGGSLGFKNDFHEASLKLGRRLMQKIAATGPNAIITDCLSCRLQFQQTGPFPVHHPLELISHAYGSVRGTAPLSST